MVALTIGSCAIVGVALLLSVVRSFERGLLFGFCGGNSGEWFEWHKPCSCCYMPLDCLVGLYSTFHQTLQRASVYVRVRAENRHWNACEAKHSVTMHPLLLLATLAHSLTPTLTTPAHTPASNPHPSDAPPEPWLFKGYQIITIILNTLVWLLLLVCVVLLAAMFLWWGGFEAIKNAIDTGVSAADAALQPTGVSLNDASTLSSRIVSALSASDSSLASIFGAAGLPFTPVCAPTCLNVGSFASLLRMSQSCVCGDALLDAARGASARGATSAAVGLAGAAAMWLASCLLLVILTSHHVTAEFDRRSAAFLKEQRAEQYDHGFAANPKDCLPVTYEEAVKDQRQPALM